MNNRNNQFAMFILQFAISPAVLIGPRTLSKPKTIQATIGYIEGQLSELGYSHSRECYDAMGRRPI